MRKKLHHEATEAIEFLSMVHEAFRDEQAVYNQFISLMREVRSGANIPNHMLIERVQKLFRGRPELVNGFLHFFDNAEGGETTTQAEQNLRQEREFIVKFLGEKRNIRVPADCTGQQLKNLVIGSLHLLPQDFQVVYEGKTCSDKSILAFEDKAEVEVREKQTYMVDFARDVLDTTKSSFKSSDCYLLYFEFLKRLCQFAESTRNAEDLAEINSVVKSLFQKAGILNELLDYLPSLIYAHPHIRLHELQSEQAAAACITTPPKRRIKKDERKIKYRPAQRKRRGLIKRL